MNVSFLRVIVPLCLAAGLATRPSAQQVTLADQLYPGAVAGDRGPLLTRLVDDLNGEPLAGAEVFLIAESNTPIAGEFWWTHRGSSDADGFVRIDRPKGNRDWHVAVVKHELCGVVVARDFPSPVVRVGRGQDVPLRIVDWLGRPAAGARVGFCGYCGHSPDVANATADAAGLALLRGVDVHQGIADLYVQHPGLHIFYDSVDWRPGDPPVRVACGYGPAQRGRVLDHRGEPVAGALVCGGGLHRGPWARTAADGSFTILGAEPGEAPFKVVVGNGREIYFDAPPGHDVVLRLPDLADPDAYEGSCSPKAEAAPALPLPELQHRQVQVVGAPDGPVLLSAWFPGCTDDSTQEAERDVLVPKQGPFVVRVHAGAEGSSAEREFPFADGAPGDGPLRVQWLPSPRVRGVLVDGAGKPCAGRVRLGGEDGEGQEVGVDGRFELVRDEAGWCSVVVRAADSLDWRCRHVRVGEPGSGDVDLGSVPVAGPARLLVAYGSGAVPEGAKVGFVRAGWFEAGEPDWWPLQPDGGWHGAELREGDAIVVERDGCVTLRTVLTGAGPWRIELPKGLLELRVVDERGQPVAATVVVGDHWQENAGGRLILRGLRPGPQRMFVGAVGKRSAQVDVVVDVAPQDPLTVVLPDR